MSTEKKGLSKREKILLYLAVSAGLLYLAVQFGITPARKAHVDKQDAYELVLDEKSALDIRLMTEAAIQEGHANTMQNFDEVIAQYPEPMSNEDLTRMLQDLCRDSAVQIPTSIIWAKKEAFAVPEDGKKRPADEDLDSAIFAIARANVSLDGDLAAVKRLLDAVEKTSYIRIVSLSVTLSQEAEWNSIQNIPVVFEVTMRNKVPQKE